ncbi:MAG: XRE family transcriptional regulator [Synechococcaceae cyanobacterium]
MASLFQAYLDNRAVAREHFGRMLRLWRERNGWTQYTVERWGKEAGFATVSSGNVSMVEQGKAGDLRAQAHFQLADVNRRIAEKDWGPVKSQEILQALVGATAIRGDDGQLWGPTEFWRCYVGQDPVPQAYRPQESEPMPELSSDLAAELSARWRQLFTQQASRHGLDPIDTLQGVARQAPTTQRKKLQAVLASFRDYEAAELAQLWQGGWLPERWLRLWSEGLEPAPGGENGQGANTVTRP